MTIVDTCPAAGSTERWVPTALTPIATVYDRLAAWHEANGLTINLECIDVAREFDRLTGLPSEMKPDTIIHFGERRAAPYSMKGVEKKRYTVENNISAIQNLLAATI